MKKLIVFLLVCSLFSCKKKEGEKISTDTYVLLNIDPSRLSVLDYKEDFSSASYIPLETTDSSLIGKVGKLYLTDSLIVVFDTKQMNILVFDNRGHFLHQIGKKGTGPDEYIFFNDIVYDEKASLLYAHERYQNRIFIYDLTGKLIKKTSPSQYMFNSFCKVPEGFWVYSCFKGKNNSAGYNLMLLDDDLQKQQAAYFPQKAFINSVFSSTFTYDEKGNAYFYYPTSNIIYKLVGKKALPAYKIDFGSKTLPYRYITKTKNFEEYHTLISDKLYWGNISNVLINKQKVYFTFNYLGNHMSVRYNNCLVDTKTLNVKVYNNPFIVGCSYPVSSRVMQIFLEKIFFVLYVEIVEKSKFPIELPGNFVSIDDFNPVLVVFDQVDDR